MICCAPPGNQCIFKAYEKTYLHCAGGPCVHSRCDSVSRSLRRQPSARAQTWKFPRVECENRTAGTENSRLTARVERHSCATTRNSFCDAGEDCGGDWFGDSHCPCGSPQARGSSRLETV